MRMHVDHKRRCWCGPVFRFTLISSLKLFTVDMAFGWVKRFWFSWNAAPTKHGCLFTLSPIKIKSLLCGHKRLIQISFPFDYFIAPSWIHSIKFIPDINILRILYCFLFLPMLSFLSSLPYYSLHTLLSNICCLQHRHFWITH